MSALSEYQADVKRRGWIYLSQLPANTPLGPSVAGRPGARSPWSPTGSWYELAPWAAQLEAGFFSAVSGVLDGVAVYAANNPLGVTTWDEDWNYATESWDEAVARFKAGFQAANNAVPSLFDILAWALGIPTPVLIVLLAVIAWAVLRNFNLVPSVRSL